MRPEHFCSGKPRRCWPDRRGRCCFNEARALLLGKTTPGGARQRGASSGRFNEARALLLGKTRREHVRGGGRRRRASMRPEHFCSGKPVPRPAWSTHRPGRFNEARALLLGKTGAASVRGNRLGRASMRPEHFCSGKRRRRGRDRHQRGRASMRPEHFCSGKREPAVVIVRVVLRLQ